MFDEVGAQLYLAAIRGELKEKIAGMRNPLPPPATSVRAAALGGLGNKTISSALPRQRPPGTGSIASSVPPAPKPAQDFATV